MASEAENAATRETTGAWTDETNLTGAHDSNCMTTTGKDDVSGEFSFGFTDVDGTIDGIEVLIHTIAGDGDDFLDVELYDSVSTWRLKSAAAPGSGSQCTDCVDRTVGGSADLWGGTWTPAHIKSTSFRIRITSKASGKAGGYWAVDYVLVTVYYTAGPIERSASASMSMTGATKRTILFSRKATAAITQTGVAKRLLTAFRAASGAVSNVANAARQTVLERTATASVSAAAAAKAAKLFNRYATAAMGLAAATVRQVLFSRSASAAVSTAAAAKREMLFNRLASASMSLVGAAKRARAFFREASASIGLAAATAKQVLYERGVTGAVSLAGNATRQAVLSRAATASIGTSAVAKGVRVFFRNASAAMSLAAATAREIVLERKAPATVSMVGNAARQAVLSRLASASMGLTGATARVKHGFRSAAASMSATGATARSIVVSRLASSSMGVVASAKRTFLASRLASAVMGLVATAKGTLEGVMLAPPVSATLRMIPQEATLRLPPASLTTRLLTASKTPLLVGGGELTYTPLQTVSKLCLPADVSHVNWWQDDLPGWNQETQTKTGNNPWGNIGGWSSTCGAVAMTRINEGTSCRLWSAGYVQNGANLNILGMAASCNWVHDKDAHKFSYEFYLDNDLEETDSVEIFDDDWTFWNLYREQSGSMDATISEETTEKVKGISSIKIAIVSGAYNRVGVDHFYGSYQDWSAKEFLCFYWYGLNSWVSGGLIKIQVKTTNAPWTDWFQLNLEEDWSGWKRIVLPFKTFNTFGSPSWAEVNAIRIFREGGSAVTGDSYLDRTVIDVGQWVKVEAYVPDKLVENLGEGGVFKLYSWDVDTSSYMTGPFAQLYNDNVAYHRIYSYADKLKFLDGTLQDDIGTNIKYAPFNRFGIAIYKPDTREQTQQCDYDYCDENAGPITYSSYYGCLYRVGFAIKMPPDDGQDASDAGISQAKIKLECFYEGNLVVEDTAGDNDGTRYGALPVTGQVGNALDFDGLKDYVDLMVYNPSAVTLELRFRQKQSYSDWRMIFGNNYAGGPGYEKGIALFLEADLKYHARMGDLDLGWHGISSGISQIIDTWMHWVVTFDGSTLKIYYNGDLKNTKEGINGLGASTYSWKIARAPWTTKYTYMDADEVRIYNRALTEHEIEQNMAGNVAQYGLVAEWKFDDDWDFGRTTFDFEDSLNQYYGLQNINEDWLCLFHEDSGVVEWLQFDHTPIKLTVRADENEEIDQLVIALSDPVLMMDMETLTSDGKMEDLSGEGNHGTLYGTEDIEGIIGRARYFNGVDDYIKGSLSGTFNAFTIMGWVKIGRPYPGYIERALSLVREGFETAFHWYRYDETYDFSAVVKFDDGTVKSHFSLFSDQEIWFHIATTYDGEYLKSYINGTLEGGPTLVADKTLTLTDYEIGREYETAMLYFLGFHDELHFFPYAMTEAQIQASMKGETRIFSEEVWLPDLTTDTDTDGVPDFLETFPPFELPDYIPVTLRRVR